MLEVRAKIDEFITASSKKPTESMQRRIDIPQIQTGPFDLYLVLG